MSVTIAHGDLLAQDTDAIVNTVNCVGAMGKGIALQFKKRFPANFDAYAAACSAGQVRVGQMHVFETKQVVPPRLIINFPTKRHWRGKSSLADIESGLVALVDTIVERDIQSISIPPLGCGLGGLSWADVEPAIRAAMAAVPDVAVRLFPPGQAPAPGDMVINTKRPAMTAGRASLLRVFDAYSELDYPMSELEAQKLAYLLSAAGELLKLEFVPHKYGPYSYRLSLALQRMDGHFLTGVGDRAAQAEARVVPEALAEARRLLAAEAEQSASARVDRIAQLIDGFQTPFGMELLATTHWVAVKQLGTGATVDDVTKTVHAWSPRKRELFRPRDIAVAHQQLQSQGWLH